MKLKYSFESVDMGEEIILVPVGEDAGIVHGILKLNAAGQEIINMLNTETTREHIISKLEEKYENDKDTLASYVDGVLANLRAASLLDE